jgi:hypothetical protein
MLHTQNTIPSSGITTVCPTRRESTSIYQLQMPAAAASSATAAGGNVLRTTRPLRGQTVRDLPDASIASLEAQTARACRTRRDQRLACRCWQKPDQTALKKPRHRTAISVCPR